MSDTLSATEHDRLAPFFTNLNVPLSLIHI